MPKVSIKRKSVSLDMTAMCDVAFLLLTFFMLTAKFRPDEAVTILPPTSVSERPVNTQTGTITISVAGDGKIFMSTDSKEAQQSMLDRMANRYGVALSQKQKDNFMASEIVGYPAGAMRQVLDLSKTEVKARGLYQGIPCDSADNQLYLWVSYAKLAAPSLSVVIKGDAESNYKVFNQVVGTLQSQNINVFQLVTGPENKPK
jgi:biopolymer transport protein ExbD